MPSAPAIGQIASRRSDITRSRGCPTIRAPAALM
jgi:hypothetical protein